MAIFHINPSTSRFSNIGSAFGPPADDTPGADTLIVDPGAFLISTGGSGAFLANTGAWTVTVNGSIVSANVGIFLFAGNTGVSTITIGVNGGVQGHDAGIVVSSSANINNSGEISEVVPGGTGIALAAGATHTINNFGTGTIDGIRDTSGVSNDTVHNSGSISDVLDLSGGDDTITNSGVVLSSTAVMLGEGTNHLTNSGRIFTDVFGGSGTDTVTNSHLIDGFVRLSDGNNTVTNSGTISGDVSGDLFAKNTLINSGTIGDDVNLQTKVTNSGTISGDVSGGPQPDTVTDYAIVGDIIKSGSILGLVDLREGDDKFNGGANPERVKDDDGADIYNLGGGNDIYVATGASGADGIDTVRGSGGHRYL